MMQPFGVFPSCQAFQALPVNRITFYAHPALLLRNGCAEVRVRTSISDSNENPHRATSAICIKNVFLYKCSENRYY